MFSPVYLLPASWLRPSPSRYFALPLLVFTYRVFVHAYLSFTPIKSSSRSFCVFQPSYRVCDIAVFGLAAAVAVALGVSL